MGSAQSLPPLLAKFQNNTTSLSSSSAAEILRSNLVFFFQFLRAETDRYGQTSLKTMPALPAWLARRSISENGTVKLQ